MPETGVRAMGGLLGRRVDRSGDRAMFRLAAGADASSRTAHGEGPAPESADPSLWDHLQLTAATVMVEEWLRPSVAVAVTETLSAGIDVRRVENATETVFPAATVTVLLPYAPATVTSAETVSPFRTESTSVILPATQRVAAVVTMSTASETADDVDTLTRPSA